MFFPADTMSPGTAQGERKPVAELVVGCAFEEGGLE